MQAKQNKTPSWKAKSKSGPASKQFHSRILSLFQDRAGRGDRASRSRHCDCPHSVCIAQKAERQDLGKLLGEGKDLSRGTLWGVMGSARLSLLMMSDSQSLGKPDLARMRGLVSLEASHTLTIVRGTF